MLWIVIKLIFLCDLYDPAQVHHGNAVGNVLYNAQIVGNKHIG